MKKKVISSVLALTMLLSFTACRKNGQTGPEQTGANVNVEDQSTSGPLQSSDDKIFGKWEAQSGPLYEINTDGSYSYFLDKTNLSDNYYKGPVEIQSGVKALADLKITTQQYLEKYSEFTGGYYNMFSINLHYDKFQSEGADKSDTLNKAESLNLLFMLSKDSEDKATIINMADSTSTELTRVK